MNTEELINQITPEAYERLIYAVETGRWPEGASLTQEQRDSCMQAVMLYQSVHNANPEHMSVAQGGDIVLKTKSEFKKEFAKGAEDIVRVKVEE